MATASKKRRQRGTGSVYRRDDGVWTGALTLPPSLDGKRRRKVVYGNTEAEAKAKLTAAHREEIRKPGAATGTPTVTEWAKTYLDRREAEGRYSAATLKGYREKSRNYIEPAIGKVRLSALTPAHIERVHDLVLSEGRSPTTARQAHMILSAMLKAAKRSRLIAANPCDDVDAPPAAHYDGTPLTAPQSIAVLDWSDGRPWHDLRNSLALLAGPRGGEALGLTRGAVHLDTNTIDFAWQLQRLQPGKEPPVTRPRHRVTGNYWLIELKRGSARFGVPMLPRLRAVMEARIAEMDAAGMTDPMDLIFTGARGGPMSPERDWARWKEALDAANVPSIRRHDARHTTATLLRAGGVDARVIQAILGHTNAAMTAHYSHLGQRERRDALAALGGALGLPSA